MKIVAAILLALIASACSNSSGDDTESGQNDAKNDPGGDDSDSANQDDAETDQNDAKNDPNESETNGTDWNDSDVCQSTNMQASIDSVYLAFAFDVSGSMGKGDYDWHDVTLKWDPVTQAARSFLEAEGASDLMASMTFFPSADDRCEDASYVTPDVPFTALPSSAFGEAMDDIREENWRGGTPTLHVMNGLTQFIQNSRETVPGKYVIVLVTDGYPQGCDDNEIDSVVSVAEAALADGISTYVIGIQNPDIDGAPETVENLTDVAAGGGTEAAFIIDTGDPEQTAADFSAVVDQIRSKTTVCTVDIPDPPDGRKFDKKKVRVTYATEDTDNVLNYDQNCTESLSWHYDNVDKPSSIVLCDSTCQSVQNTPDAALSVEFTCIDTIITE